MAKIRPVLFLSPLRRGISFVHLSALQVHSFVWATKQASYDWAGAPLLEASKETNALRTEHVLTFRNW